MNNEKETLQSMLLNILHSQSVVRQKTTVDVPLYVPVSRSAGVTNSNRCWKTIKIRLRLSSKGVSRWPSMPTTQQRLQGPSMSSSFTSTQYSIYTGRKFTFASVITGWRRRSAVDDTRRAEIVWRGGDTCSFRPGNVRRHSLKRLNCPTGLADWSR